MTTELSGRRVFLASPGGLEAERALCRLVIAEFNQDYAYELGVAFVPTGWEDVAGTVGRPQSEINLELRRSDYLVTLLWDRWGSPTYREGPYSSGTEEEFFEAVGHLADAAQPLRDILVLFKSAADRQLGDPGEQLRSVLAFRTKLEDSKEILFHTFDSTDELKKQLSQSLRKWAKPLEAKVARSLTLSPGGVADINATVTDLGAMSVDEAVTRAEEFAQRGLRTQAEVAFAHATDSKRPDALLKFAKFMRRTGRLDRAIQLNRELLTLPSVAISMDPAVVAQRAEALANIGVIHRKQGRLRESRVDLEEAVETARGSGAFGERTFGYALDNVAITLQRLGDVDAAAEAFEQALTLRRRNGDREGEAQSLMHLARMAKLGGDLGKANELATAAMKLLEDADAGPALANAASTLGEIVEATGDLDSAAALYEQALEINHRLGNSDGASVANVQLARLYLTRGDADRAEGYAEQARFESNRSSNQEGIAVCLHLLGQIELSRADLDSAIQYFRQSLALSDEAGDAAREAATRVDVARALVARKDDELARDELRLAASAAVRAGGLLGISASIDEVRASIDR